jgi:hypothetical protein
MSKVINLAALKLIRLASETPRKAPDVLTRPLFGGQMSDAEKKDNMKKVNGIFEMRVKQGGKEGIWTIDLKKVGWKPNRKDGRAS